MDFKARIKNTGLKQVFIADKLGVNYNSFKVYLHDKSLMPEKIRTELNSLLKKYE